MIPDELTRALQLVGKDHQLINNEVSIIYKKFQELKLKILGYSWNNKCVSIFDVIELDYNNKLFFINKKRGCYLSFPIRWLSDPNWEKEAIEGIKIERDYALIDKLQS